MNRDYLCIDLKSFYASVECVERGLDPLATNLVVADPDRSEKTICLAVSPSMKALGVKNRCRVFEIPPGIDYIMATPRMQLYIEYSSKIYSIYLQFISSEDIHVYSCDEAFLDVTDYLHLYDCDAKTLGKRILDEILKQTGLTATCGVGTNIYLAKIALDILAKHAPDYVGVLTEESYREKLWKHRPLTDFWRVGRGTAARLAKYGIETMEQIAKADEDFLHRIFGIDYELLYDHAWGIEPVTIADIKKYQPKTHSFTAGQVLPCDYSAEDAAIVIKEMADLLCLRLVDRDLFTESITLYVGYSNHCCVEPTNGTAKCSFPTSSAKQILPLVESLFYRVAVPGATIRRMSLCFNRVVPAEFQQYDLFTDPVSLEKERKMQKAALALQKRFGKNAVLKGMNLQENATTIERNGQIGGHKK